MRYEDLESWQLEDVANRVHEMVGYFNRLRKRMAARKFKSDRIGELVGEASEKLHTLWVHLHYASCDATKRERDKSGERKHKPQ